MGLIGKLFAPLAWLRKSRRGSHCSVPDTAKLELKAEALAWAANYYPDERVQNIAARFVLILNAQLDVSINQLRPNTRFLEDLGLDSDDFDVLLVTEDVFQIPAIPEVTVAKMRVIDDVIHYLAGVAAVSSPLAT
jgi:acyl carrier protein